MKTSLKINYGIGQISDGVKQAAWASFLIFYYNQVLGLSGTMAGLAAMIAMGIDAITDPMMGHISDRLKSRFGRRHPLMLMGAVPFALSMMALFAPPEGLGDTGLFWWLLIFAVALRLSLTFFYVPHLSLGAELEQDYHEKTSLIGYRIFFAFFGILFVAVTGFALFFPATEAYPNGLLNPAGYANFGLFAGVMGAAVMLWTVFTTRHLIPHLPQPTEKQDLGGAFFAFLTIFRVLKLPSFKVLFVIILMITILTGVSQTLLTYLGTYVYKFTPDQIGTVKLSIILGLVFASMTAQRLSKKYDKRGAFGLCLIFGCLLSFAPIFAYLFGVLDSLQFSVKFWFVFLTNGLSQAFFIALIILMESMLSDIIDENQAVSGKREEGFFFAVRSFGTKAGLGVGTFVAGVMLDSANIPQSSAPTDVSDSAIQSLAMVSGPGLFILFLSIYFVVRRYPLDAARHQEIREKLQRSPAE